MTEAFRSRPCDLGKGFYALTEGPLTHIHTYHKFCPWSPDAETFVFFEYEPGVEHGRVKVMDVGSDRARSLGVSIRWCAHSGANAFWIGETGRLLYQRATREDGIEYVIANPEGGEETFRSPAHIGAGDERGFFGGHQGEQVFPEDRIADRDTVGVLRVDLGTRETELIYSIRRVLDRHPEKDKVADLHVAPKQYLLHPRLNRLAFNFNNATYPALGVDPFRNSRVFALDLDADELTPLNPIGHHPIWHPTEPWILSFSDDAQGRRRLTFDKLDGRGGVEREFLEYFSTSGHPSVSPTLRYILVDNYAAREKHVTLDLFDLERRETIRLAQYPSRSQGYPHSQAKRGEGEPVWRFLSRVTFGPDKRYMVQAHPAWDRTGRYFAFNADLAKAPQVYVCDLAELGLWEG